jgi:asparagine synthase (glutamine-hydrolysing)
MCGICGIYNNDAAPVDLGVLNDMNQTIRHRGPDDEGIMAEKNIGFAHKRLSIIDLEGGHQPIHNEDKSVWLTSNNEIYNHKELRSLLESKGHTFSTRCDTEVIIHAYEEFGTGCVEHFNGMFAFSIWDAKKKRIFMARDRLGIKPLYYYCKNGYNRRNSCRHFVK